MAPETSAVLQRCKEKLHMLLQRTATQELTPEFVAALPTVERDITEAETGYDLLHTLVAVSYTHLTLPTTPYV